jgi:methylated-DNA-protein-cysteine methyltransferase-like protein
MAKRIPHGKVATYGQLATYLGSPRAARAVGYAMFNVPDEFIPWHRVINSQGRISIGGHQHRPDLQRIKLENEGVEFSENGRIDLKKCGWVPASGSEFPLD